MTRRLVLTLALLLVMAAGLKPGPTLAQASVILSTTTSTQDSGLLDVLVPMAAIEVPPGVLTAFVGVPVFVWLLAVSRRGWQ